MASTHMEPTSSSAPIQKELNMLPVAMTTKKTNLTTASKDIPTYLCGKSMRPRRQWQPQVHPPLFQMSLPLASGTNSKGAHPVAFGYDYKKGQLQHGFQRLSCRFFFKRVCGHDANGEFICPYFKQSQHGAWGCDNKKAIATTLSKDVASIYVQKSLWPQRTWQLLVHLPQFKRSLTSCLWLWLPKRPTWPRLPKT